MTDHTRGPGLRVVICDDHRTLREALRNYLLKQPGIASVALAADADEAVHLVRDGADVLVLDLMLPGESSSLDVLEAVGNLRLDVHVLLLSATQDPDLISRAMALGATGYCPKHDSAQALHAAIVAVSRGEILLPDALVGSVLGRMNQHRRLHREDEHLLERLTRRERDVLRLLSSGHRRETIARRLGLSPNTVRTHVSGVLEKLGVHDQLAAAARGRRLFGMAGGGVVTLPMQDVIELDKKPSATSQPAASGGHDR